MICNGGADDAILTYIFSNIRITLEKKNEKNKYPYLSLYCNWYQHSEIDRSITGFEIIQKIGNLFLDNISKGNDNKQNENEILIKKISSSFGFGLLKKELNDFLLNYKINPIIVNKKNWNRILIGICNDLSDRPIQLPAPTSKTNKLNNRERQSKRVYQQLESRAKDIKGEMWETVMPVNITINLNEDKFLWHIKMKSIITISGGMTYN